MDFNKFYKNGEAGIGTNGIKVPENDRLRRYTAFALKFHPDISGKKPNDPKVVKFMEEQMGSLFATWNKYDWTKINLKEPFPETNPPLKS
jgi:hypothetical protein